MGIIKEYYNGAVKITVRDDFIKSPEEQKQIWKEESQLVYNILYRQYLEQQRQKTGE